MICEGRVILSRIQEELGIREVDIIPLVRNGHFHGADKRKTSLPTRIQGQVVVLVLAVETFLPADMFFCVEHEISFCTVSSCNRVIFQLVKPIQPFPLFLDQFNTSPALFPAILNFLQFYGI